MRQKEAQRGGEAAKKPGMEINRRLFALTGGREGVRGRIALAAVFGLLATATGVARLTVQGSVVAMVFAGVPFSQIASSWPACSCSPCCACCP